MEKQLFLNTNFFSTAGFILTLLLLTAGNTSFMLHFFL